MSDDPAVTSFGAAFVGRTEENSLGSIPLEISWVFLWPDPSIIALENLFNAYLKQLTESYETESILHITSTAVSMLSLTGCVSLLTVCDVLIT